MRTLKFQPHSWQYFWNTHCICLVLLYTLHTACAMYARTTYTLLITMRHVFCFVVKCPNIRSDMEIYIRFNMALVCLSFRGCRIRSITVWFVYSVVVPLFLALFWSGFFKFLPTSWATVASLRNTPPIANHIGHWSFALSESGFISAIAENKISDATTGRNTIALT